MAKRKGNEVSEEVVNAYEDAVYNEDSYAEQVEIVDVEGMAFDAGEAQAADEANAWIEGRMWKRELASKNDGERRFLVVVMDLHTRKIAGEFHAVETENGIHYEDVHALLSRVGERSGEAPFRAEGWGVRKDVQYNTLTHEIRLCY